MVNLEDYDVNWWDLDPADNFFLLENKKAVQDLIEKAIPYAGKKFYDDPHYTQRFLFFEDEKELEEWLTGGPGKRRQKLVKDTSLDAAIWWFLHRSGLSIINEIILELKKKVISTKEIKPGKFSITPEALAIKTKIKPKLVKGLIIFLRDDDKGPLETAAEGLELKQSYVKQKVDKIFETVPKINYTGKSGRRTNAINKDKREYFADILERIMQLKRSDEGGESDLEQLYLNAFETLDESPYRLSDGYPIALYLMEAAKKAESRSEEKKVDYYHIGELRKLAAIKDDWMSYYNAIPGYALKLFCEFAYPEIAPPGCYKKVEPIEWRLMGAKGEPTQKRGRHGPKLPIRVNELKLELVGLFISRGKIYAKIRKSRPPLRQLAISLGGRKEGMQSEFEEIMELVKANSFFPAEHNVKADTKQVRLDLFFYHWLNALCGPDFEDSLEPPLPKSGRVVRVFKQKQLPERITELLKDEALRTAFNRYYLKPQSV